MRALSAALLAEQKKPSRKPAVKVEVQEYDHPAAFDDSDISWTAFKWELLHSDSNTQNHHAACIASDGSLNRIRVVTSGSYNYIYHQRVVNPDENSDYTNWTNIATGGGITPNSPVAIAANPTNGEVVIFASVGNPPAYLYSCYSNDYGANWGGWGAPMTNCRPCERGVAAAFKPNGDLVVVHASDITDPKSLYAQRRTAGVWNTGIGWQWQWGTNTDIEIESLAMMFWGYQTESVGDFYITALILEGSLLRPYQLMFGDGYAFGLNAWSNVRSLGLSGARVDIPRLLATRGIYQTVNIGPRGGRYPQPFEAWQRHTAVQIAMSGDILDISCPYLANPSGYPAIMSMPRDRKTWMIRLDPAAYSPYSGDWDKADIVNADADYGLALACTSTHIFATQADQVWRSELPSSWSPPTTGTGAGDLVTLNPLRITRISESVDPLQQSELVVEINNIDGEYDTLPTEIKRGSRVNLHIGYYTTSDEFSEAGRYFIEKIQRTRSRNHSIIALHCIDAWGLLQRFQMNKPVEWNLESNTYHVGQMINMLMQSIGGSFNYTGASSNMTTLYPRLEINAGETAASIIKGLLNLVPDVIYFFGLTGYAVNPQSTDAAVYSYYHPA